MNWRPDDDFLEMLMSGKGDEYLDREIQRLRIEIGEKQFQEFAQEYFKNEGEENIYAPNKQQSQASNKNSSGPERLQQGYCLGEDIAYLTQPKETQAKQSIKTQENPLSEQIQQLQGEQGTTNNEEGLLQISRQALGDDKMKIMYNNGDYYEGEVENGEKSGWGTYYYSSGEKYSGCFIEDEIHGYGRYYFLSGADYEGDWSSGMKHGIGILKFSNGDIYEGGFSHDQFHGNGIFRYKNGDVFQGKWKKGRKQGRGQFKGADGHLQIGEWVDDKFQI